MKYVLTIVIVLVALAAGSFLYAWSGIYNIAATKPHWAVTLAFIEMLQDRSIAVRSDDIRAPNLDDPQFAKTAFTQFHEMCRLCHGAPGYRPGEFASGFYPAPPDMTSGHIQEALSGTEIYWIVKHGIKMTGMPAFGPTHEEKVLWGLVALAKEIPKMSPKKYRQQVNKVNLEEESGHGHGEPEGAKSHGQRQEESPVHSEAQEDHD